jgi:PEP-CTERM/exosortase A-associated glycosyltransferase
MSTLLREGLEAEAAKHAIEVRRRLHELVSNGPLDAEQLSESARVFAELGDTTDALRLLGRATELAPDDTRILFNHALVSWGSGRWREADGLTRRGRQIDPADVGLTRLSECIQGTLRVYRNGFYAPVSLGAVRGAVSDRETRPLHALAMSLPQRRCGYTYRTHYLLKAQRDLGFAPIAATAPGFPLAEPAPHFAEVEELDGIPYHRLAKFIPFSEREEIRREKKTAYARWDARQPYDVYLTRYSQYLGELAQQVFPGILHAHSNHLNALAAGSAAQALGIPHVYEVRGLWEETDLSLGRVASDSNQYAAHRGAETRCCVAADAVVTLSETMKNELVGRGISAEKIFLVPNAIDPGRLPVLERDAGLAEQLALGDGPVIGYVGSISAYEGLDQLVRAFARVHREIPTARLLIVGDGRWARRLHESVAESNVRDAVRLVGRVSHDKVLGMYSLIDVFVVPRLPYRVCEIVTPIKPYEAMATGRALVVSDVAALREMIVENETALSFKAGSEEALAAACLDLCRSPETRARLGQQAAHWVRKHRTWTSVAHGYRDAYDYARAMHRSKHQRSIAVRA